MKHLLQLPSCTLITTGRTGTDFLQSLLDSHTEVLTFNGILWFHEFWETSKCVESNRLIVDDILVEFIGKNIHTIKSFYDFQERKDCLGINGNQSINIDADNFKNQASLLLSNVDINSKNVLIAIYGAYAICMGQRLDKKRIIFHHIHHAEKLNKYLADFPDSKIICMTRDPRANFLSGIKHWQNFDITTDHGNHLYYYINRIFLDAYVLSKYANEYLVIRIEDLGDKKNIKELCKWLGILYEETLMHSTWGGMKWHGDRISGKENKEVGWSKEMLNNNWKNKLSTKDKYLFNFLLNLRLRFYNYEYEKIKFIDYFIVPIIILFPLSFERRFFSLNYIRDILNSGRKIHLIINIYSYFKRVSLFYRYYQKTFMKEIFYRNKLSTIRN